LLAAVELGGEEGADVVEEGDDELGFVVVAVGEFRLTLHSLLRTDEGDRRELLNQPLSGFGLHPVQQVVFVEEVIGDLGDVRVAAVLGAEEDAGLALVLEADEEGDVGGHYGGDCFGFGGFEDLLLLEFLLLKAEGNNRGQLQRITHSNQLPTVKP